MGPSSPPKWKKKMGSPIPKYFALKKTTKNWIALLLKKHKNDRKKWDVFPKNWQFSGGLAQQLPQAQRGFVNLDFC